MAHNLGFNNGQQMASGAQVGNFRINVHGVLVLSNRGANGRSHRACVQAFHSGIIEAVDSPFLMCEGTAQSPFRLTSMRMEATIVQSSRTYLQSLQACGAVPPYVVLVSLIGVGGVPYSFAMGNTLFEDEAETLDRDQFHFTEMVIEDVPFDRYEQGNSSGRCWTRPPMRPAALRRRPSTMRTGFCFEFHPLPAAPYVLHSVQPLVLKLN